jgi:hypothetical protein
MCETSKKQGKPCRECPFNRKNVLGPTPEALGHSRPEVYIGQSEGPFWLPCHMEKGYRGKETTTDDVGQCRGAAIYKANLGISEKMPKQLLRLPKDTETVFADHAEFLMFYRNWTRRQADEYLKLFPPAMHMFNEIRKQEVKIMELS